MKKNQFRIGLIATVLVAIGNILIIASPRVSADPPTIPACGKKTGDNYPVESGCRIIGTNCSGSWNNKNYSLTRTKHIMIFEHGTKAFCPTWTVQGSPICCNNSNEPDCDKDTCSAIAIDETPVDPGPGGPE